MQTPKQAVDTDRRIIIGNMKSALLIHLIKKLILRCNYFNRIINTFKKRKRIKCIEQLLPKNGVGAELGVFKGHLSPILLKNTNAKKLHLIDPWYFLSATWSWADGNRSTVDALIQVLHNFKREIEEGRIVIHVGDDIQVLNTFPDKYFDWVYIDSSHAYEHTKEELKILNSKVKDDGVIAGDDWQSNPRHRHHGVYKAVNEFIAIEHFEILYSDDNDLQWAIRRIGRRDSPNH